jgi:Spy/CpxP family protein refolding chaperone
MRLRLAAAALALLVAASAHAQKVGPPAWLEELDLTDAQQEQVFQIFHKATPVIRERLLAARHAHEELEDLALAVSLDSDRGREALEAQTQALADIAEIRLEEMRRVHEVLTTEQRARAVRYE